MKYARMLLMDLFLPSLTLLLAIKIDFWPAQFMFSMATVNLLTSGAMQMRADCLEDQIKHYQEHKEWSL